MVCMKNFRWWEGANGQNKLAHYYAPFEGHFERLEDCNLLFTRRGGAGRRRRRGRLESSSAIFLSEGQEGRWRGPKLSHLSGLAVLKIFHFDIAVPVSRPQRLLAVSPRTFPWHFRHYAVIKPECPEALTLDAEGIVTCWLLHIPQGSVHSCRWGCPEAWFLITTPLPGYQLWRISAARRWRWGRRSDGVCDWAGMCVKPTEADGGEPKAWSDRYFKKKSNESDNWSAGRGAGTSRPRPVPIWQEAISADIRLPGWTSRITWAMDGRRLCAGSAVKSWLSGLPLTSRSGPARPGIWSASCLVSAPSEGSSQARRGGDIKGVSSMARVPSRWQTTRRIKRRPKKARAKMAGKGFGKGQGGFPAHARRQLGCERR